MNPDPNWLLSSAAQSAAALVAIVGGFLVSRVLSIAAERDQRRRTADQLEARARGLSQQAAELRKNVNEANLRLEFRRLMGRVATDRGLPEDIDALVADVNLPDDMKTRLREQVKDGANRFASAYKQLAAKYQGSFRGGGFDALHLDVSDDDSPFYEAAFDALRQDRNGKKAPIRFQPGLAGMLETTPGGDRAGDAAIRELQAAAIRGEASALLAAADQLAVPPDLLWWGFGILVAFAALGILVPIWFLFTEPTTMGTCSRFLVAGAFSIGLLALLAYLFVLIRTTNRVARPTSA